MSEPKERTGAQTAVSYESKRDSFTHESSMPDQMDEIDYNRFNTASEQLPPFSYTYHDEAIMSPRHESRYMDPPSFMTSPNTTYSAISDHFYTALENPNVRQPHF